MTDDQRNAQRASAARRNANHEAALAVLPQPTRFQFTFTEEEIEDLAAGLVPHRVRADARAMLDFDDLCRRNAARPIRKALKAPRRRSGHV